MDIARHCTFTPLALAVSGCGGPKNDTPDDTPSALGTASASEVDRARAYIGQFTSDDPDRCFANVGLDRPTLEARAGNDPGSHAPPLRVAIAIDGSGSMAGGSANKPSSILRGKRHAFSQWFAVDSRSLVPCIWQQGDNSAAGKAKSCAGVDVLAPVSNDRARLVAAVSGVRAVGWTPLAAGLEERRRC
jgi:Ca-activated chloride channel homolog